MAETADTRPWLWGESSLVEDCTRQLRHPLGLVSRKEKDSPLGSLVEFHCHPSQAHPSLQAETTLEKKIVHGTCKAPPSRDRPVLNCSC